MLTSPTNQVTEDEAELLESLEDEAANSKITLSFLLQLGEGCLGTAAVLRCLEMEDGGLVHLETRQPRHDKVGMGTHTVYSRALNEGSDFTITEKAPTMLTNPPVPYDLSISIPISCLLSMGYRLFSIYSVLIVNSVVM